MVCKTCLVHRCPSFQVIILCVCLSLCCLCVCVCVHVHFCTYITMQITAHPVYQDVLRIMNIAATTTTVCVYILLLK